MDCTKSAKKSTENGSHLAFLINTWCYQIYNIPIGFSDLENVGLDTKFVFRGWPKVKIWAIQFSEDFDGGHFEKCTKRWGQPNLYGVNISIIDQWGPLNKIIPLMEDPGGGGVHGDPYGPMDYCPPLSLPQTIYLNVQTADGIVIID